MTIQFKELISIGCVVSCKAQPSIYRNSTPTNPFNRHDWSDSYFIQILKAIRTSMSPKSRILICDLVMNTTCGFPGMKSAPSPLPANYGYFGRYAHHRDLGLMTVINGIERTPSEFEKLIEEAGLKIIKILETRSLNSIVEVGL